MSSLLIRELSVDQSTRDRLENVAWRDRTTLSNLVRDLIEGALGGEFDKAEQMPDGPARSRLGVKLTDELWEKFGDKAWRLRTSRAKLLRIAVQHRYGDVPTDRTEVVAR